MRLIRTSEHGDGILVAQFLPATGPIVEQMDLHEEVTDLVERIRDDRDVKAAVLTGTDDVFYQGPSLASLAAHAQGDPAGLDRIVDDSRRIVSAVVTSDKPTIAAVNGKAIGLGCQLAFFSDFVFAVQAATFQDTHVRVGIPAGDGGTLIYPLLFGMARAKRALMMGEKLTAAYAVECGAVEAIVAEEDLLPTALRRAARLTGANYPAIRATKAGLNRHLLGPAYEAFELAIHAEKAALRDPRTHAIMQGIIDRD
jgi:enoyl-CoA hydratase